MSCIFGENRDIFFPKLSESLHLISFSDIAIKYLNSIGYDAQICNSEEEARELIKSLPEQNKWPCLFTKSDTTGEKDFEEFYTDKEMIDMKKFTNIGVIKNDPSYDINKLNDFKEAIDKIKKNNLWSKKSIVNEFLKMIPEFKYVDKGKYLSGKM